MPQYIANNKGFYNNSIVHIGDTVTVEKPFDPIPSWLDAVQAKSEPMQAASTRRAKVKKVKKVEVVEEPDFSGNDEPEQI